MEEILDTPENELKSKTDYAGFWIRFAAYLVDAVAIYVIMFLLMLILFGGFSSLSHSTEIPPMLIFLFFGIILLYEPIMNSSQYQGTLGKMAVRIKVTDLNGNRISFGRALARFLSKIVSVLILYIGFIIAAFDDKKQGLHDKMAGTYVVMK